MNYFLFFIKPPLANINFHTLFKNINYLNSKFNFTKKYFVELKGSFFNCEYNFYLIEPSYQIFLAIIFYS